MSKFDYDVIDCPKFLDFTKATSPQGSGADDSYFDRHEESPAGGIALRKPAAVALAESPQPQSAMNTTCALQDVKEKTSSQASTSACSSGAPAGVHKPITVPLLTKGLPKQGKQHTAAVPAPPAWRSTFATRSNASDPQSRTAMPSLLRKFCGLRVQAGDTGKQAMKQARSQPGKVTKVDNKEDAASGLPRAVGVYAGNTAKQAMKQASSLPGKAMNRVENKKDAASGLPRAVGVCAGNTAKQAIKQASSVPGKAMNRVENKKDAASGLPRAVGVCAGNTGKQAMKQASSLPGKAMNRVENKKDAARGLPHAVGVCAGNIGKQAMKQASSLPGKAMNGVENKKDTASGLPRAMPRRPGRPLGTRDTNVVPCHTTTAKQPVLPRVKKTLEPAIAPALRTQPGPIAVPWRPPGVQATRLQHAGPRPGYVKRPSVSKPSKGCNKEVTK